MGKNLALGESEEYRKSAYRELFKVEISGRVIDEIRLVTQKGLVFGSDAFKQQLSELLGRNVANARRGRPRSEKGL